MQMTNVMITHAQVNLVSVNGRLDRAGLRMLQKQLDILLDAGARFVLADLSRVEDCDNGLPELLGHTSSLIRQRGGWLRLIGPGTSIVSSVDDTADPVRALEPLVT